jgi:hypothetical protein
VIQDPGITPFLLFFNSTEQNTVMPPNRQS